MMPATLSSPCWCTRAVRSFIHRPTLSVLTTMPAARQASTVARRIRLAAWPSGVGSSVDFETARRRFGDEESLKGVGGFVLLSEDLLDGGSSIGGLGVRLRTLWGSV